MKIILVCFFVLFLSGCAVTGGEEMLEIPEQTMTHENMTDASVTMTTEMEALSEPELLTKLISPRDTDFVRISDYIPDVVTELKYATADNFTGQVIYEFEDIFLRYGTVRKLMAVCQELTGQGLGLKIWDGFRPVSAQFKLWEICPDSTYVANPNRGYSNHSRGFAVDLTLIDGNGNELEMPTAYDDFSGKADRDYTDCTPDQASNARYLEEVMEKHGFHGYQGEWWHFNDTTQYDVETCFDPGVIMHRKVSADTPLLKQYWETEAVLIVPAGEGVTVLGYREEYALAEFWGYRGYVSQADLA